MLVNDEGSDSASCAPVEEAICSIYAGVDVPIPTRVLLPPFTYIALGNAELVDVAKKNVSTPAPPPQELPVFDTSPLAATDRQPDVPPPTPRYRAEVEAVPVIARIEEVAFVAKRLVDEAVPAKKLVEVEFVVVD